MRNSTKSYTGLVCKFPLPKRSKLTDNHIYNVYILTGTAKMKGKEGIRKCLDAVFFVSQRRPAVKYAMPSLAAERE